jgi:oligopeptide transport system permease protein
LGAIPTLLLVIVLAFLMVHVAPGGPFTDERVVDPAIEASLNQRYGLDDPLPVQLVRYVGHLLQGDLGPSYKQPGYTVAELIGRGLSTTVRLGLAAILLALAGGIAAGVCAALNRNTFVDRLVMGIAMTGISIPVFVIAPVLVLLLAVQFGWLPAGWSGNEGLARWVLPVVSLALPQLATVARLIRASMIDILASNFIRTARAQGLGMAAIVRYHALKPALLPVLSYLGPAIAAILTGSVVVEQIFGIDGLGRLFVKGSFDRDYMLVLGIVVFYAVLVIALNFLVDVLYGVIDPRIRRR